MNDLTSLSRELLAQLEGAPMQQLSKQLNTDTAQTSSAVNAALPLLFSALGRNAQQGGAASLMQALQRDHAGNGGVGQLLSGLLGGGQNGNRDGAAILGHIFGQGQQARVETSLGQATGIGNHSGDLLKLLAPIVMSFLAQRVQSDHLDADALGRKLNQERYQAQQQGGAVGGLIGNLLDQDGDGQLGLNDLVKIGSSLFGARR